jgi:hypothetical protein
VIRRLKDPPRLHRPRRMAASPHAARGQRTRRAA